MQKSNVFIFSGIFYIFGIFINNLLENLYTTLLVALVILVIFLCLFFYTRKFLALSILTTFSFVLGAYVSDFSLSIVDRNLDIVNSLDEKVLLEVEINKVDKITDTRIVYIGKTVSPLLPTGEGLGVRLEIGINSKDKLEKGTIIKFEAKPYRYEAFNGFQYDKYMYSNGLYFRVYPYNYEIIGQNKVNPIIKVIGNFREDILIKIKKIYTPEEAIFLGGILVGARENMPKTLGDNFNNSGLTHLIAVSGFNITILVIFFGYFIKYFPPYIRFILISIVITLFTILVGFNPPVIRAAIMGIIGYFVLVSGRQGNILAIVVLTAILMVTYSPLSINYDASLHLSFLAVLGIVYTEKFFEKVFKFMPNTFEIRTATAITFSALVFTFPVMMFNFGQISIVAPLSNVLVTWTIPIVMLFGFVSIILYSILPILGMIVGYFARILLRWDILVVNTLGSFRYGVWKADFGDYSGYLELFYFMILVFVILWFKSYSLEKIKK